MILVSVDPNTRQVAMVSIPRDAWVGLDGLVKVVDALGGVDLTVLHPVLDEMYPDDLNTTDPYAYFRLYIPAGPQHLDGRTALQYVRSRHGDLQSDFGRSARPPRLPTSSRSGAWQENATVQVLNGSAEAGLAGRLNAYLAWQGFNVVAPSNADRSDYPTSTVTSHTAAASATAQALANVLHAQVAASFDGGSEPAITVVLGRDHASFPDVNSP